MTDLNYCAYVSYLPTLSKKKHIELLDPQGSFKAVVTMNLLLLRDKRHPDIQKNVLYVDKKPMYPTESC